MESSVPQSGGQESNVMATVAVGALCVLGMWLRSMFGLRRTVLSGGQTLVRPARIPLVGIAHKLSVEQFVSTIEELTRVYGDLVEMFIGSRRVYLIADVEMAKELLSQRPKIFRRPRIFDYPAQTLGATGSPFFANGHYWNVMRKSTSPSFNKHNVESHINDVWAIAHEWTTIHLRNAIALEKNKESIEFKTEALSFTLKVITKVGFGIDSSHVHSHFNSEQFVIDLQNMFTFALESFMFPLPIWAFRYFPQYKYELLAKEGDVRLTAECMQQIEERRQAMHSTTTTTTGDIAVRKDWTLLDSLLRKNEGQSMTDAEVLGNVKTFYLAGSETTSISIAYALFYLSQSPLCLSRLREESDRFHLRVKRQGNVVDTTTISEELVFAEAVLKETLRLTGPASILGHELESDSESYTFANGLTIHPGDSIMVNLDGILRNEKYYPNPWVFQPDRWLDATTKDQCEAHFLSFGFGPRVCPGQRLAMLEGTLALTSLVHEWDFQLACAPSDIRRLIQFTSCPDKMPIRFTPRK